jgi:glyceraldehyde 3-phosphate dehydrogenase
MPTRVAINGFGRTGRAAFRAAYDHDLGLEWAGINDLMDRETLVHLLRHDSVYGPFPGTVEITDRGISVDGHEIPVTDEADPAKIGWENVDVVIESTGSLRTRHDAARHIAAGARKVIISAPAKGEPGADVTVVLGVNYDDFDADEHDVISNASCTTNCLAPVAKVLHDQFTIRHGSMTTVHAYTGDQRLLDFPHKDLRRARAAALNIVPTTTGAARAIGLVIPELQGRLDGCALRVPTPTGSLVDLTVEVEYPTSKEEVNHLFSIHADRRPFEGILGYSEDAMVSTDVVRSPYSAIVDGGMTSVVAGTQVKLMAWYDNEWGYSNRLIELASRVGAAVKQPA